MITHWDEPVFPDGPADLFYARIRCLWECYRDTCLADFWIQRMQGKTTAWLCRMEETVTVCGVPPADWAELAGFVSFLGPREVFGPPEMELCASTLAAQGVLLRCARLYPSPAACPDMEMVKNPSAGRVYDLLSQCRSDTLTLPDRDGFLSDYARRIRRGVGRSRLVRVDGAGRRIGYDYCASAWPCRAGRDSGFAAAAGKRAGYRFDCIYDAGIVAGGEAGASCHLRRSADALLQGAGICNMRRLAAVSFGIEGAEIFP